MSTRSAALLAGLLTLVALAGSAHGAEVQVSEQARALFKRGVQQLTASKPDYAAAYEAFKAAYDDSPSPKILGNLGLCATKLERDGEAIDAYETYLKEAGAKSGIAAGTATALPISADAHARARCNPRCGTAIAGARPSGATGAVVPDRARASLGTDTRLTAKRAAPRSDGSGPRA